MTNQISQST